MTGVLAIAARELSSFFRLPVGWITIALFAFVSGIVFARFTVLPGEPATLRAFFQFCNPLLIVVCPAISMRLVSEELRSGTIEPLVTSPISDLAIVLGKALGALAFLLAMLLPTAAFVVVLALVADKPIDPGPIAAGYLSLVLTGGLYLSIGLLVSTLTSSQTLAFLGAFLALIVLLIGPDLLAEQLGPPFGEWLYPLGIARRVADFAKGVVDTAHIGFFVAATAWFVLASYVALASRRWR